jgi:hypothetical protein
MSNDKGYQRYIDQWGNYKSDKHKSKRLMRSEIIDILVHGSFNNIDLIDIRDFAKGLAFEEEKRT